MYITQVHYKNSNAIKVLTESLKRIISNEEDIIIVCVGTDRVTFDSIGPLGGTMLKNSTNKLKVYGELYGTINATNIDTNIKKIKLSHVNASIVAIDACISDTQPVGNICIKQGATKPGLGAGKNLEEVGDFSIHGIIGSSKIYKFGGVYKINTNLVIEIAEIITVSLMLALNI